MKKIITILLVCAAVLSLAACRKDAPEKETEKETEVQTVAETEAKTEAETEAKTEANTDYVDTVGEPDGDTTPATLTEEEALQKVKDFLGERDPDTGYLYSVQFESADKGSYTFRVSWYLEDQERYSECGKVIVDPDGNVYKFDW